MVTGNLVTGNIEDEGCTVETCLKNEKKVVLFLKHSTVWLLSRPFKSSVKIMIDHYFIMVYR